MVKEKQGTISHMDYNWGEEIRRKMINTEIKEAAVDERGFVVVLMQVLSSTSGVTRGCFVTT